MYNKHETFDVTDGCGPNLPVADQQADPLRQQVFEHVRAVGRAARADVTRALGISPGSVTTLTADLIATGLLREVEGLPRESGRGRPPVALEVVPESNYVIGIKLSDVRHTAVLTDFAGNICADATLMTSKPRKSLGELLDEVAALMESLIAKSGMAFSDISAVGIGVSGMVENQSGTIAWSPLLTHRNVPLGDAFQRRFEVPVYLDNDVNLLTLAELWFGAGREMSDFVVVTVEHGVGMGLVLNNRLFRGSRGMGMELGHTKVQLDGALCRCGQRGCLEAYIADYALAREAATAIDQPSGAARSPQRLLEELFVQAKDGNQSAQTIFRRAGRYLSVGLANVIQLFDPELVILAGERMRYDYLYEDDVIREMESLTLLEGRKPPRIVTHAWGDFVWARGATALALSAVTNATLRT
ncbi:Sugar kinase of the NBD/HSP70 family, may contain an N-terminal HTH domain [Cognatiyoonia koreensis]|uniref:Sugar kinase of the NBD/HSP70 family, may contain an N-terminal HTH domain n=1 Tax=Cognatiyoonia koreensis TaxID=364200 RepID=A0A1I0PVA6_9RHOB|nr:ROK family protein [Cognatiyoonia koreensis]SEW18417.1 Sugar kinase of the NBD/HSP70 family, may contain an N-terminal HTH domain [Cognatiyoonia koreensis]